MTPKPTESPRDPRVSVIIPVLNERGEIGPTLASVREAIERAPFSAEVIVVDGGSDDGTRELLRAEENVRSLESEPGRAEQMNAGAEAARGPWLFFLHADTHLEPDHFAQAEPLFSATPDRAMAFELRYRHPGPAFRRMERGIAWRSHTFGLPYGDQAFCLPAEWFRAVGGFRGAPHLEDVDMVLRLRSLGRRFEIHPPAVLTSARQYEAQGVAPGVMLNLGRLGGALVSYALSGDHFRLRQRADRFPSFQKAS